MFEVVSLLGDSAFAECGRPLIARWSPGQRIFAVASTFEPLGWDGRQIDRSAGVYRVALYDGSTLGCVGVLDRAGRSINDMAFHPSRSLLAIASGEYDGGFLYEGDLFLWDFERDEAASVLSENREVVTCKFNEAGDRLRLELRPPTDEDEDEFQSLLLETEIGSDSWRVAERSIDVESLTFAERRSPPPDADQPAPIVEELSRAARSRGGSYQPRWLTWDVDWSDGDVLACRDGVPLERWSLNGDRAFHVEGDGMGVQVVAARNGVAYLNLFTLRWDKASGWVRRGSVERADTRSGERTQLPGIDFPSVISVAGSGDLLVRDANIEREGGRTRDRIISPDGHLSDELDLGRYDLFNHYLPINHGPALYFLQGTPPDSHAEKWICELNPQSGRVARLFPLEWNRSRDAHLFGNGGCYVRDDSGSALVIGSAIYDPSGTREWLVTRRDLPDGHVRWERSFASQVTALESMPVGTLFVSLSSGEIGAIDAKTGEARSWAPALTQIGRAVVLSASVRDNRVAAGMTDGRIAVYEDA